MENQYSENIKKGMRVEIVTKQKKSAHGIVDDIAAREKFNINGILVRLKTGEIGRVQKIIFDDLDKNKKNFEEIKKLVKNGESLSIEFKSDCLWSQNYTNDDINLSKSYEVHTHKQKASKVIIAKSIAALLNSEGGNLIIGVKEKKDYGKTNPLQSSVFPSPPQKKSEGFLGPKNSSEGIFRNLKSERFGDRGEFEMIGIQDELKKLKDPSKDDYKRMIIDEILRQYFSSKIYNHLNDYIGIEFVDFVNENKENKIICWIKVRRSDTRVFLKLAGKEVFMIRTDTQSRALEGEELVDYCMKRWGR